MEERTEQAIREAEETFAPRLEASGYLLRVGDLDKNSNVITAEAAESLAAQAPHLLTFDGVGLVPKPEAFGGMDAGDLRRILEFKQEGGSVSFVEEPEPHPAQARTLLVAGRELRDNSALLAVRRAAREAEEPEQIVDVRDALRSPEVMAASARLAVAAGDEEVPDNRLRRRDGTPIDVIYRTKRSMRPAVVAPQTGAKARRNRAAFRLLQKKERKLITTFLREIVRDPARTPEEVAAAKAALQLPEYDERKKRALAIGAGTALAGLWAGEDRRGS